MCGICGLTGLENTHLIHQMVASMAHRGPDDCGVYAHHQTALGMARLAIIDTSLAGHQPMTDEQGDVWIVFNGEMYNFRSERKILEQRGYRFRSQSDTEVILQMYRHYGDDFLRRMRGMFALAIYDQPRERLLLARDQMGIKPLLYAQVGDALVFGSEIKTLLASGVVSRDLDLVALRQLLTYGSVCQPRTLLRQVSALLPAHYAVMEKGVLKIERYWSLGANRVTELAEMPYEEQVKAVEAALDESVQLQMMSDVPLGAFLSGGVDSGLLVAMMARHSSTRLKTYSVGFQAEGEQIDESQDAARNARHIGTDHQAILVTGADVRDQIRHIASGLDQPTVDGVNTFFVSRAARQGFTVAISGTGGDELFAGYPWFNQMVLASHQEPTLRNNARRVAGQWVQHPAFNRLMASRYGERLNRWRGYADFLSTYGQLYQIYGVVGAAGLLAAEHRQLAEAGQPVVADLQNNDEVPDGTPVQRVSALCLRGYTTNQLLRDIDAASMAWSLEVRVPFLDPHIADIALSLPDQTKLGDARQLRGTSDGSTYREMGTKRILIDIGRKLLPPDFDRQPKRGFAMPFDSWLRHELRDVLLDTLASDVTRQRGWLDVSAVDAVRDGFFEGRTGWAKPWLLMMLELWQREVLHEPQSVL